LLGMSNCAEQQSERNTEYRNGTVGTTWNNVPETLEGWIRSVPVFPLGSKC
jgi:hypothetical protein